jgi:hypothetical protein
MLKTMRAFVLEVWPVTLLLFAISLAGVINTLWTRAPFDTDSTLALLFVGVVSWLVSTETDGGARASSARSPAE